MDNVFHPLDGTTAIGPWTFSKPFRQRHTRDNTFGGRKPRRRMYSTRDARLPHVADAVGGEPALADFGSGEPVH